MTKCNIIEDLLPLYVDHVASEESANLIESHIKECTNCRNFLDGLQADIAPTYLKMDNSEIGALRKMKKKLRKKNLVITLTSILTVLVLIYGVFFLPLAIPYDAERISVEVAYDSVIDISFDGLYLGARIRQEGDAVFIGFRGTLFSRLSSPLYRRFATEPMHIGIGSHIAVDYGRNSAHTPISGQVNRVYYLDFRTLNRDTSDLSETRERANLIWERGD
jgi:hypothetical protein